MFDSCKQKNISTLSEGGRRLRFDSRCDETESILLSTPEIFATGIH